MKHFFFLKTGRGWYSPCDGRTHIWEHRTITPTKVTCEACRKWIMSNLDTKAKRDRYKCTGFIE